MTEYCTYDTNCLAFMLKEKFKEENEKLKAQNKKMKRCEICKHRKDKNTKCLKTKLKKQKLICSAWELEE